MNIDGCTCGQHTIKGIVSRSGVVIDDARIDTATSRRKYADNVYRPGNCLACTKNVVESSIQRAKGSLLIDKISSRHGLTWDQKGAVYKFAGKCYADLGRKAIVKTVELFREVTCLVHNTDYRECIHKCAKCEDNFKGCYVDIDHCEPEFRIILLAFLDAYVQDWCEPPNAKTVKKEQAYGWKNKLSKATTHNTIETEQAYWRRVQNNAKSRWLSEGLEDKFSQFHDSVAKLQTLCKTCHGEKTSGYSAGYAEPVHIESLGASKKRKRDDEKRKIDEKRDDEQKIHEARVTQLEFVAGLIDDLKSSITSMDKEKIADALKKVPPLFGDTLPMVKTARQLLVDLRIYNDGGIGVTFPPLRLNPFAQRQGTICWVTGPLS